LLAEESEGAYRGKMMLNPLADARGSEGRSSVRPHFVTGHGASLAAYRRTIWILGRHDILMSDELPVSVNKRYEVLCPLIFCAPFSGALASR
jgi:hypothetical protein